MRTRPLVVRCCATVIPLAHLLIVISLFFPYSRSWGTTGWQVLFPSPGRLSLGQLDPYYLSFIRDTAFVVFIVFALPAFAAVAVFRSPTRILGLLGVWISLPLTLLPCFVCASNAIHFHEFLIDVSPAVWFPPVGFALSFISCLVLALYLPLLRAREQAMGRSIHLEARQHERAERVSHPNGVELPAHVTRPRWWPSLAFLGLLCHLLIGLSLFFPFTELHDMDDGTITTTGWQMLSEALQIRNSPAVHLGGWQPGIPAACVASLLLAALVLPALIYLACLLPFPWKNGTAGTGLRKSTYLSYLLTTIGFSLSSFVLGLSLFYFGSHDLYDPFLITYLAFVIPPAAFLLSLLCSTALLGYGLWLRPNEPHAFF